MSKSVIEVLREARAKVQQGWTQGRYRRDNKFCTVGAIQAATPLPSAERYKAYDVLEEILGPEAIVEWNDAPGRTQAEVVALFDAAIARAEGTP